MRFREHPCRNVVHECWEDVDLEANEIRLRDSKTGPRVMPLSPGAARLLASLPRDAGNPWVIAGSKPGSRLAHIIYYWYRVRERAGLDDVRIHDLRHSFASRALALGESLPTIGKLLGHSKIQTTARYAHLARDSVHESAGPGRRQHRSGHTALTGIMFLADAFGPGAATGLPAALNRRMRGRRTGSACLAIARGARVAMRGGKALPRFARPGGLRGASPGEGSCRECGRCGRSRARRPRRSAGRARGRRAYLFEVRQ